MSCSNFSLASIVVTRNVTSRFTRKQVVLTLPPQGSHDLFFPYTEVLLILWQSQAFCYLNYEMLNVNCQLNLVNSSAGVLQKDLEALGTFFLGAFKNCSPIETK